MMLHILRTSVESAIGVLRIMKLVSCLDIYYLELFFIFFFLLLKNRKNIYRKKKEKERKILT